MLKSVLGADICVHQLPQMEIENENLSDEN